MAKAKSSAIGSKKGPAGDGQTRSKLAGKICFRAKLLRPKLETKGATWTFLVLPKAASARLPSRGMNAVEGTLSGVPFQATLEPDGRASHWLKVERKLRVAAGAEVGDEVALELAPSAVEPEPKVPADLRRALVADPKAQSLWLAITTVARRDWIQWIDSAKRAETRVKRIAAACDMLSKGKRRPCCFDRSGIYSKGLGCPVAEES